MTPEEYRAALAGLSSEQLRKFKQSWGGAKDTIDQSVDEFASSSNPEQWDQIAVHRLREVGVTSVRTESEKAASSNESSVASATRSAQAAEHAAEAARSSARWTRLSVAVSTVAVIVVALGVWIDWRAGADTPGPLTLDEACELLVANEIRQILDGWAMRFQTVVWCNRNGQGDVSVTITPANRQEGRFDTELTKSQAESAVRRVLERKGWQSRFRQVAVQVLF